jgi:bifunctional non-homologous end joining protein LigD
VHDADLLVVDLDPGAPADVLSCAEVALLVREYLSNDGLTSYAKTSGSKGMQVYAPITPASERRTSDYAHDMAKALESAHPKLVLSRMAKNLREGKVFVDWSQNNGAKTTVAPYSLRAREQPWVSTPLTWDEVAGARRPTDLQFVSGDVLDRVASEGDLFAGLLEVGPRLP